MKKLYLLLLFLSMSALLAPPERHQNNKENRVNPLKAKEDTIKPEDTMLWEALIASTINDLQEINKRFEEAAHLKKLKSIPK